MIYLNLQHGEFLRCHACGKLIYDVAAIDGKEGRFALEVLCIPCELQDKYVPERKEEERLTK